MLRRAHLLLALVVLGVSSVAVPSWAQSHFTNCLEGTGNVFSATLIVPVASTPDVAGKLLPNNSEIAVFSSNPSHPNLCVGLLVWKGANSYLTVWGDDPLTSMRDGLVDGETLFYRVWDSASNQEYPSGSVQVQYGTGNGRYGNDALMVLSDLSVSVGPIAPTLVEPFNGATGISIHPELVLNQTAGVIHYRVQLALASDNEFATPLLDSTLTTTSLVLDNIDLLNLTAYRWRARMRTGTGFGPWSASSSFTTSAYNLALKKVFLNRNNIKIAKLKWNQATISKGKVDIYVDSLFIKRTGNDGKDKVKIYWGDPDSFNIYFCAKNSTTLCSNTIEANFALATVDLFEEDEDEEDDIFVSYRVGDGNALSLAGQAATEVPDEIGLYPNYPNPFNYETTIGFGLPEPAHVTIEIFNMLGQRVTRLLDTSLAAGRHGVRWAADHMPNGIYFCRMRVDETVLTRQLTVVK